MNPNSTPHPLMTSSTHPSSVLCAFAMRTRAALFGFGLFMLLFGPAIAADSPKPLLHESLDTLEPSTPGVTLSAAAIGPGKFAQAVLLERPVINLLNEADFPSKDSRGWNLENGVTWEASETRLDEQKGAMRIPANGVLKQTVANLKPRETCCFSVYARSADGNPAKLALEWGGSEEKNLKEFEVGRDWRRFWVAGKAVGGGGTPTLRCVAGKVLVERPQFEAWVPFPSTFLVKGPRRAGGLVWKSQANSAALFDGAQGTFSMWIKPLWAGQTTDLIFNLFTAYRNPGEAWKTARSAMAFSAYLSKPDAKDYQYSMTLTIRDKEGTPKIFSIPAQGLTPEWHHVAIAWNLPASGDAWVSGYLDGEQAFRSEAPNLRGMEEFHQVTFGEHAGAALGGWLDEVAVYGTALGEEAIKRLAKPSP